MIHHPAGCGLNSYANGNLTNDGSQTYLYNSANQLIAVTAPGLTWSAAYNGDGARLKQIVNGAETAYTLDLAAPLVTVLAQQDARGTKQYVYGQGDSPLAGYDGATWTYLSGRDGINSVRQETDASGNVITVRGFDPYGVPLSGNGGSPFGYTGEVWDASTQLVFLRARYMQPGTGVFLSHDSWRGDAWQPGTFHGWNYALSNPLRFLDPSGLQVEDFRVRLEDAGSPAERTAIMVRFKNEHWNYGFADPWDVLGREISFVEWMYRSQRLTREWYNVADQYLTASRFAGARVADYIEHNWPCVTSLGPLEPGVAQWANLVLAADENSAIAHTVMIIPPGYVIAVGASSTDLNVLFWRAHNSSLREGVMRADSAGLRQQEPLQERILINYVLYNVLEPGDQCGNGNGAFCAFTFPFELTIGSNVIYPQTWPATEQDIQKVDIAFYPIYFAWRHFMGARPPSQEVHLNDMSIHGPKDWFWPPDLN